MVEWFVEREGAILQYFWTYAVNTHCFVWIKGYQSLVDISFNYGDITDADFRGR